MAQHRKPSPTPGSQEWVELRRTGLGATDAAVVAGFSRWASPFDKYNEMLGRRAPIIESEAMLWGTLLERPVGMEWARRTGKRITHDGFTYWREPGIFSHYDFNVVGEKAILEVKTSSAYGQREWGEQDTDQVPREYLLQAHHEIMCRPGIERCYLAVLIGGQKLQKYVIERDDELIEYLLTKEREFLANVAAGIAPEIDGSDAATDYLRELHPRDDGTQIEMDESLADIAREYLAEKAAEKAAQAKIALLGNVLRERLADASVATSKDVRVTLRATKDRVVTDWKACVVHAEMAQEYIDLHTTTTPGTRPLVVTWVGDA